LYDSLTAGGRNGPGIPTGKERLMVFERPDVNARGGQVDRARKPGGYPPLRVPSSARGAPEAR